MALQVFHSPEEWRAALKASPRPAVATIGNFDGVHIAHQKILRAVVERARAAQALASAITFDPHPVRVLRPETAPPLIITLRQRLEQFERLGVEAALVLKFDLELSRLTPTQFAERILVETMRATAVLVGPNFRFGHQQAGDVTLLKELGGQLGFSVEVVPAVSVRGQVVSSTLIRQAVREGRVERAEKMLGRPFSLTGQIQQGTGQGRRLVLPTLNLAYEQELLPMNGVYATETLVAGALHRSASNVGLRPTFDGRKLSVESHLFDFSEELSAGAMEVRFRKRLRDEKKFGSPEALRSQILRDLERARAFFARLDERARQSGARTGRTRRGLEKMQSIT